ncbi:protein of unknown function [Magnetospirillum gryphiswaldense MSR-1 v2]|uniref:Uncharacterized protein n=1 Tax=Magnetospirillum gryphiswaldense (strain DSM 6361 / JCM 21280 / NBRC 15271 / MSR-1) TaxID=431944 RepID=V6EX46_MAGGM|nr:protein of unknown function [Magnetospirillum gryphiswaldense MSR-1 v2]
MSSAACMAFSLHGTGLLWTYVLHVGMTAPKKRGGLNINAPLKSPPDAWLGWRNVRVIINSINRTFTHPLLLHGFHPRGLRVV